MAPTSFDQWFAIHNAKSENKISEELKSLFEECWNTARANVESDNKDLEDEIERLQDEIDSNYHCPYDGCIYSDYEDVESDLEDANEKLRRKICIDPIIGDTIIYSALQGRKNRNKEKYKDVVLRQCLVEVNNEKVFCCSGLSE